MAIGLFPDVAATHRRRQMWPFVTIARSRQVPPRHYDWPAVGPSHPARTRETQPAPVALGYARAPDGPSVGLHRWAIATLAAMFPLIWFGGLTTSHGAGMSVPDWPNTYGYNMFAVPWSLWLGESAGGIFYEHTHRLLGSLAGLFAVAATLWAWGPSRSSAARRRWGWSALVLGLLAIASYVIMRADVGGQHRLFGHLVSGFGGLGVVTLLGWLARTREPRRWVRWTALALLITICVQGLLGGLRVTEVNLELAITHGIFAQLTFCLAGFLALATSGWWMMSDRVAAQRDGRPAFWRLALASGVVTLLVFAQLIVAAFMRHYEAGMAVPDFPLSYGRLVPPASEEGLARANDIRVFDYKLAPTTLGAIWLHTAHRLGAVLVTLGVIWVMTAARGIDRAVRPSRHVWLVAALLVVQAALGMTTVWMNKPADIATSHVAVGAVLFLSCWLLTVRAARLYGWRPAASETAVGRDPAPTAQPRQLAPDAEVGVPVSV